MALWGDSDAGNAAGDELTYTVVIKNTGVGIVVLKDTIPNGTSLVGSTVTVN